MRWLGSPLLVIMALTAAVWSQDAFECGGKKNNVVASTIKIVETISHTTMWMQPGKKIKSYRRTEEIYRDCRVTQRGFKNYTEAVKSLNRVRINDLVWSVQQVLDKLKEHQKEAYKAVKPQNCPLPVAPKNGGLVCVTVDKIHYCKPMCNQGYDFSFLRRSKLYEECSNHTDSKWTTQFIGGSRLAECIASDIAVSGGSSAYFPLDMTCQKVIANASIEDEQIGTFLKELRAKDITENHNKTMDVIICGD